MSDPSSLNVNLGDRSYDIVVGSGLLGTAGQQLSKVVRTQPAIIISDETVAELHLSTLEAAMQSAGIDSRHIVLPAGEETKDFEHLESLIDRILETGPDRHSCLIALGGGVIGDIVGVAASLILRGIDYVQIPTTLLSQVDSSVGGKTAINSRRGKNLIGSFYQPRIVLADTDVLNTLERREVLSGYAEVVKYGLINDLDFFEWLDVNGRAVIDGDPEARRHAILTSCRAKAAIVSEDERETGKRALLNLGHTFGHALETESGFGAAILHGEAVALGTILAFELSSKLGLCPLDDVERVKRHFKAVGLPSGFNAFNTIDWKPDPLIDHMRHDKKSSAGKVNFILVRGIGDAYVERNVNLNTVATLLEEAIAA